MKPPKTVARLGRGPNNNSGGGKVATPVSAAKGAGAGKKTPTMRNDGKLPTY